MIKKILAMVLAIILVAALSIGGTVAYLMDDDYDANTMTMGDVTINQLEYERVMDENGNPVEGVAGTDFTADYGITRSYKLREYTQDKPALPAVYPKEDYDDFQQLWNGVGAPGSNDLFDDSMKNVVDKFVFVQNTSDVSECYYRTIIAIEQPLGLSKKAIHLNFNNHTRFDYDPETAGTQGLGNMKVFFTYIDGTRYAVYTATHTPALAPHEISRPSLLQLFLDPMVNNEDCAKFGEKWDILVLSQAAQTPGFANADEALNTSFGAVTEENVIDWFEEVLGINSTNP